MEIKLIITFRESLSNKKKEEIREIILVNNPKHIPRIGEWVNMGINLPYPTEIVQVCWDYNDGIESVTCFVEDV